MYVKRITHSTNSKTSLTCKSISTAIQNEQRNLTRHRILIHWNLSPQIHYPLNTFNSFYMSWIKIRLIKSLSEKLCTVLLHFCYIIVTVSCIIRRSITIGSINYDYDNIIDNITYVFKKIYIKLLNLCSLGNEIYAVLCMQLK